MTISSIYGASAGNQQNVTPAILSSTIDSNGNLVLVYANGAVVNVGHVVGRDGATGPQGAPGTKGDKGDQGPAGKNGEKGEQGVPGIGKTGAQGPAGIKGDKGSKGDTGPQGIQGPVGPKGDKGDRGDSFSIQSAGSYLEFQAYMGLETATNLYPEGTTYMVTSWDISDGILHTMVDMAGDPIQKGSSYLFIKVSSNIIGNWSLPIQFQGAQGKQGPIGPKGDVGPAGPQGDKGPQGDRGEQGYYVSAVRLENNQLLFKMSDGSTTYEVDMVQFKGEKGAQGPQGIQGPKGDRGESFKIDAKITIDSITISVDQEFSPSPTYGLDKPSGFCVYYDGSVWYKTNSAEASTTTAKSLWSPAYRFQGDKGATGSQGVKGDRGIQGVKGDRGRAFAVDAQGTQRPSVAALGDGFTFYHADTGMVSIFDVSTGNWKAPVAWRGLQGETGPVGRDGIRGIQGEKGDTFTIDVRIDATSKLSNYNSKPKNYTVYSEDTGKVYFKLVDGFPSGYTNSQLWSEGFMWRGPQGLKGETGTVGPKGDMGVQGFPYKVDEIINKPVAQSVAILGAAPYTTKPAGYSVLFAEANATPYLFIKPTASTWSAGSPFGIGPQGPKGDKGDQGVKGDAFIINEYINTSPNSKQVPPSTTNVNYKDKPIGYNVYDEFTGNLYIKDSAPGIMPIKWNIINIKGPKGDKGDGIKFEDLSEQEKSQLKGPQGPQGPQGPASVLRGNWSPNEDYKQGDMVYYGDSIFQVLTDIPKNFPAPTENSALWAFVYTRIPVMPLDAVSTDYAFVAKNGQYEWMKRSDFISSGTPIPNEFKRFTLVARHNASDGKVSGTTFALNTEVQTLTLSWVVEEFESSDEAIISITVENTNSKEIVQLPSTSFTKGVYVLTNIWKKPANSNFIKFVVTFRTTTGKSVVYNAVINFILPGGNKMWSGFLPNETLSPVDFSKLKSATQVNTTDALVIDRTNNASSGSTGTQCFAWVAYTIDKDLVGMPNVLKRQGFPVLYRAGITQIEGVLYQMYRTNRQTGAPTISIDKQD